MAKETQVQEVQDKTLAPSYEVVGLTKSENMPHLHKGRTYNLAKLSEADAKKLVAGGCPYIRIKK